MAKGAPALPRTALPATQPPAARVQCTLSLSLLPVTRTRDSLNLKVICLSFGVQDYQKREERAMSTCFCQYMEKMLPFMAVVLTLPHVVTL